MRTHLAWIALSLIWIGCAPSQRPAIPAPQCTYSSDCGGSQICSAGGRCIPQCQADRDCAVNQVCTAGACKLPAGRCAKDGDCAAGQVCGANGSCGKSCAASSDCGAGFICLANACVAQQPQCLKDVDCGAGHVCTTARACAQACSAPSQCGPAETCSAGVCVAAQPQCATSADCAAPQVCRNDRCIAQCSADQDCGAGQRCQSGACQALPPQCARNSDCPANKACVAGACADPCVGSQDCAAGTVCNLGLCVLPVPQCATSSDCASGQACSPAGQCVASCSSTQPCATGLTCSNGACVATGASTASIGGQALYTGQTNHAGISVTLRGPGNAQAVTDATGAYLFQGLPPGLYQLTFSSPSSAEGTLTAQVAAKAGATTMAATVNFTPQGELKGVVQLSGQSSALNIQVFVAGTSRGASTDAAGNFDITGVPVGAQTLVASYPGYTSGSAAVTVTIGAPTVVPTLTLQPQVVVSGSIFAFSSQPPLTVVQNHAYSYTAVAGGGGVGSVSYSLAAGPPGMSISAGGAVSYTPTSLGSSLVAIAANGGGPLIYQTYTLTVTSPLQSQLSTFSPVRDGDTSGGVTWVVQDSTLTRKSSTATTLTDATTPQRAAASTGLALTSAGPVTAIATPGGTVTSLAVPAGVLSASWPGGKVTATTIDPNGGSYLVASVKPFAGTVQSIAVPGSNTITAGLSYASGTGTITTNKLTPTVTVPLSGIATALSPTQLTDSGANFTFAANTKCLTDSGTQRTYNITGVTPTQLTITTGDLTSTLAVGRRYFVVECWGDPLYTATLGGTDFSAVGGRYFDVYVGGTLFTSLYVNQGFNGSFNFYAPVSLYGALTAPPASGNFVLITQSGGYYLFTLNDPAASFPSLAGQSIGFPGFATTYAVDSSTPNTATSVNFRVPAGVDVSQLLSRQTYVIANGSGMVSATAPLGTAVTAGALVGSFLWNDSLGQGYAVSANTANAVTLLVPAGSLLGGWATSTVVPTTGTASTNPQMVVTDQAGGLPAGGLVGLAFARRSGNSTSGLGTISANTANTVTWSGSDCGTPCPNRLKGLTALLSGANWLAQSRYGRPELLINLNLNLQGAPALAVDSLVGRGVLPEGALTSLGNLVSNQGASLTVTVNSVSDSDVYAALSTAQHVYLTEGNTWTDLVPAMVTVGAAAWTPGAFVGQVLVGLDGSVVGTITANTATTLSLNARVSSMNDLAVGQSIAVGRTDTTSTCGSPGQFNATVTLAGATLSPNSYDALNNSSYISIPVVGNDATSAIVAVCPYRFYSLVSAVGSPAALTSNGVLQATLFDQAAAYVAQALVGATLYPQSDLYFSTPVVGNTSQSLTLGLTLSQLSLLPELAAGSAYVITDTSGSVQARLSTSLTLTPGALTGRFVHVLGASADLALMTVANDAGSVTVSAAPREVNSLLSITAPVLQIAAGTSLTLSDSAASFAPGALQGQAVQFAGRNLLVTGNTATSLSLATGDASLTTGLPAAGSRYTVPNLLSGGVRVRARADGSALVGLAGPVAALATAPASGPPTLQTPFGTGRALSLTPRTGSTGTYSSITGSYPFYVVTDPTASWTPSALAGAAASLRYCASCGWATGVIVANTATTLTVYSPDASLYATRVPLYAINPLRYDVAGGGLTPHALAGTPLWLQGTTYLVRDNDAGSILLELASTYGTSAAPDPSPTPQTGWLLSGLRGHRVNGIALNGSGYLVATDDGVAAFDGSNWSHLGLKETSGQLGTGTVDAFTSSSVTCTACNFTPNALAGAQLLLADGAHAIQTNSAHVISLNDSIASMRPPLLGDTFAVLDGKGLAGEATDVAVDGAPTTSTSPAVTWVPSAGGLLKGLSGGWSTLTAQSTQSAPGKLDGLPPAALTGAAVQGAGTLWVTSAGSGVARLASGAWTQFTVAGTASAPGKSDGLPGDNINRVTFDGSNVWFAGFGAASFNGSKWTSVPSSLLGTVNVVVVTATPADWFGTGTGLYTVIP